MAQKAAAVSAAVSAVSKLHPKPSLEIERKFHCTPHSIALLRANSGTPPFRHLTYHGQKTFTDSYYDQNGKEKPLFSDGIYIRRRGEDWQAKIRRSGDYQNSTFEEVDGRGAIGDVLTRRHGGGGSDSGGELGMMTAAKIQESDFGLMRIARFTTTRETWKVDRRFDVVVDSTDFGHVVGEVELQHQQEEQQPEERSSSSSSSQSDIDIDSDDSNSESTAIATTLHAEIDTFMQRYPWAFLLGSGKVHGKLTAYFARER